MRAEPFGDAVVDLGFEFVGRFTDEVDAENLRHALSNVNDLLHVFLEWRHKVMVRFAVAIGAVIVALPTIPGTDKLLRGTVLAIGAAFAAIAWRLDAVNQTLIDKQVYAVGAAVESNLELPPGTGVFTAMQKRAESRGKWWKLRTYHQVLQTAYALSALGLAAGALYHLVVV